MNKKYIFLILVTFFFNCAPHKYSKQSILKDFVYNMDFYEIWKQERFPGSTPVEFRCFRVEEEKVKKAMNAFGAECWERELKNAPERITYSELKSIKINVAYCYKIKLYQNFKDYFFLNESPESIDECKKTYEIIKLLK